MTIQSVAVSAIFRNLLDARSFSALALQMSSNRYLDHRQQLMTLLRSCISVREMLQTYLIPALFNQIEFIRVKIPKQLALTARPLYFNPLSADSLANTEVSAQITL